MRFAQDNITVSKKEQLAVWDNRMNIYVSLSCMDMLGFVARYHAWLTCIPAWEPTWRQKQRACRRPQHTTPPTLPGSHGTCISKLFTLKLKPTVFYDCMQPVSHTGCTGNACMHAFGSLNFE